MENCFNSWMERAVDAETSCDARRHIIDAWERCEGYGLRPGDIPDPPGVSRAKLEDLSDINRHFEKISYQYMKKINMILPQKGSMVFIADKEAAIIRLMGCIPELESFGFKEGSVLSERYVGNNAVGTCVVTTEPTIIYGNEHFLNVMQKWSEFAVPINDCHGEFLGLLGVILPAEMASQNVIGMIMVAARGIEKELQLVCEYDELMGVNEMLSQFGDGVVRMASMLSHEIKNSLSTISAYIQLLQLENTLDNFRADKILSEIKRVNKILNDFKSLARPAKFNFSKQSLEEIIRYVVEIMKPKANMEGIDIILDVKQSHIIINADRDALRQVFINFVENAIQAMQGGGVLTIGLSVPHGSKDAFIEVKDTGKGIPKENISEIFKPFYTTKKTGTGLGLALCENIIKIHGGSIQVDSTVGTGTTFTVRIPKFK